MIFNLRLAGLAKAYVLIHLCVTVGTIALFIV
jgi:hypothetical protein